MRSLGEVLSCFEDFDSRPAGITKVWPRGLTSPIFLRNGTSDFAVFLQVFVERQYDLPEIGDAKFIIDAGANIGLTSALLLSRFPNCKLIAIEPDSENIEMANRNLEAFGNRCRLIRGAVWYESGSLQVTRGSFADGRHWATQTLPKTDASKESVSAFTLKTIFSESGFPRLDFLKIDIEGAELQVFRDGDKDFLEKTKCCAVECHSQECVDAFTHAVESYGFTIRTSSELHVASRKGSEQ